MTASVQLTDQEFKNPFVLCVDRNTTEFSKEERATCRKAVGLNGSFLYSQASLASYVTLGKSVIYFA